MLLCFNASRAGVLEASARVEIETRLYLVNGFYKASSLQLYALIASLLWLLKIAGTSKDCASRAAQLPAIAAAQQLTQAPWCLSAIDTSALSLPRTSPHWWPERLKTDARRTSCKAMMRLLVTVGTAAALQATQPHPLFALSKSNTPKPVNRVLAGNFEHANPKELINMLPLHPSDRKRATEALSRDGMVVTLDDVVTQEHCERLITFAKAGVSNEVDSVDGASAHQATLPAAALEDVLGREGYQRLLAPAAQLLGAMPQSVSAFVRKYSTASRPRLPFHCDSCDASISVNLVDGGDYDGGDLVMLANNQLLTAPRQAGSAAAHSADVAHAVTDVTRGGRWSLVVFTHKRRNAVARDDEAPGKL